MDDDWGVYLFWETSRDSSHFFIVILKHIEYGNFNISPTKLGISLEIPSSIHFRA